MTITLELTDEQVKGLEYRSGLDNKTSETAEDWWKARALWELDQWYNQSGSTVANELAEKLKDLDDVAIQDIKDFVDSKVAEKQ